MAKVYGSDRNESTEAAYVRYGLRVVPIDRIANLRFGRTSDIAVGDRRRDLAEGAHRPVVLARPVEIEGGRCPTSAVPSGPDMRDVFSVERG